MDDATKSPQLVNQDIQKLYDQIKGTVMPPDLVNTASDMVSRLERMSDQGFYSEEFERTRHYVGWITSLPWDKRIQQPIDIAKIKQVLDKHHYGMREVKERILEYMSVTKLRTDSGQGIVNAPIIFLVGLVGTGKTTFASALSEALGRPLARIPFGGMGSARDLRGQSRLHLEAEPGHVIKALRKTGVKNPIILLDEIDRVTVEARADIMGVLVELLDPGQNTAFVDHYIDYPFDLSEVLFLATGNNTANVATAVLDRLEPIQMPSYTDEEKTHIAREHLMPRILAESNFPTGALVIDEALWPTIVRPLGYDAGLRTLNRTLEGLVRKAALILVTGQSQSVHLTVENIKNFLPKW